MGLTSGLLALLASLACLQLLLWLVRRLHLHRTFERMRVPGPKPNLIHGQLYDTRRQPYVQFAHKMHQRFGQTLGVYLGGDPYLLTKDLELIRQVFVANSRLFYDRMNFYMNVEPVPDNLICQRGDRWRYMRRLLTPAFSNARIRSSRFYRDTELTCAKLMGQLEAAAAAAAPSGPLPVRATAVHDLYDRMAALALDVIIKTAFHMDDMISFAGPLAGEALAGDKLAAGKLHNQQELFLSTVKRACRLAFNPLVELIFCFPFLNRPLTYLCNVVYFNSIIQLLFRRLDQLVRRSADQQRDRKSEASADNNNNNNNNNSNEHSSKNKRRIVDTLVEVLRDRKITRSEFTGNAFVIVFAGFETTANALTFTLWLLAKHQRVQEKLRSQLNHRLGPLARAPAGQLSDEALAELATGCEYLEQVLNESLRLYPPVPGLSCRQASRTVRLASGLVIERGVNVIPSAYSIHRDRSIWGEDAADFRPERFELLDVSQLNSAMFMPFGLGPRNCIGKALAMHEMKILVGRLVCEYSLQPLPGLTPDKLRLCSPINITLTSADKIPLQFVKLPLPQS